MIRAACTIVSLNYLPYARTLCESFLSFHPDYRFYILLVDRLPPDLDLSREKFQIMLVEDLGIRQFPAVAFKYGVLELNTNVKPTFLKRLFADGVDQVAYLDPDILICAPLDSIYEALATSDIVLTPHCTSPNQGGSYAETLLLVDGVFNLGFIGLSGREEALAFLDWWEERCLTLGYNERWSGLFVDQKWINLVPCYFNSVLILKHAGCNVAYWNLHERTLTKTGSSWTVNQTVPLVFFHFSGMSVDGGEAISKHTDQFDLKSRPDLASLFAHYRDLLARNGIRDIGHHAYAFGVFTNGARVTKLQRAAFAANSNLFGFTNPFDSEGPFYRWLEFNHLSSEQDSSDRYGRKAYDSRDFKVRAVTRIMRLALRLLGTDRYTILMKYLEYASVLRNQRDILGEAPGNS